MRSTTGSSGRFTPTHASSCPPPTRTSGSGCGPHPASSVAMWRHIDEFLEMLKGFIAELRRGGQLLPDLW